MGGWQDGAVGTLPPWPYFSFFSAAASSAPRNRVTVVLQTGHGPLAMDRPLAGVETWPFSIVRFVRHLTQ